MNVSTKGWVLIKNVIRRFDAYQQSHSPVALVIGVVKKYVEDRGPSLAALLAYYGVLSVFPLLLVLFTSLGLLFSNDAGLQHRVIHSALSQFPVVGKQLNGHDGITELRAKGLGLAFGLAGLFWGSIGVTKAGQRAMADVWNVPQLNRPHFLKRIWRSVQFLGVLVLDVVVSTALAGLVTFDNHAAWFQALAIVVGLGVNVALFLLGFRILTPNSIPTRTLMSGAAIAAFGWSALQYLGTWLVGHELRHASQLYGYFASILGLVFFLYLAAEVTLIAAEINVVKSRHLYPRSLTPPFTPADEAVLTAISKQSQQSKAQNVRVDFEEPDSTNVIVEIIEEPDATPWSDHTS
ncbi:MAG TPA: YihY/virulence factor BrkB family protein [Acidimicrobiales bacterium]|nr:YihY/virulence factor BrkB family protein [Acidimicrobiales bacterium]